MVKRSRWFLFRWNLSYVQQQKGKMMANFRVFHMRGIILPLGIWFRFRSGECDSLLTPCRLTRLTSASMTHKPNSHRRSASIPKLSGSFSARDFEEVETVNNAAGRSLFLPADLLYNSYMFVARFSVEISTWFPSPISHRADTWQ